MGGEQNQRYLEFEGISSEELFAGGTSDGTKVAATSSITAHHAHTSPDEWISL